MESLRYRAVELESPELAIDAQFVPESMEYSQLPCVEGFAALAVIATALRVSPSVSKKEPEKRLATLSPAGSVLSSATAASEGLPLAMGASLKAVMDVESVIAVSEMAMSPPLLETFSVLPTVVELF